MRARAPGPAEFEVDMRLLAIQELRALAALLVVVHHALTLVNQYGLGDSSLASFGQFYWFGNAGVDIFFVISGFIMMYSLGRRRGEDSWHGFLLRRAKRIVPLYWVLTTLLVGLMLVAPALFSNSRLDPAHTLASYLLVPYPDAQGVIRPLLAQGWTLTLEMLFYLVFALLLSVREDRLIPALAASFALFIVGVELLAPEHRTLSWLANPIMFEFVFGCFVARVYLRLRQPPDWLPAALAAIAALLFGGSLLVEPDWMERALFWGVPAMFLVAAAAFARPPRARLGPVRRTTAALGDASYSLYLIHLFVLPAVAKLWRLLGLETVLPADAYVLAATVGSCVAAFFTYHVIEKPLGLAVDGKLSKAAVSAAALQRRSRRQLQS